MNYDHFKKSILKLNSLRRHKIKNSIGVYDIYKYIRKNKWFNIGRPLTEKEFYAIIRKINKLLAIELSKGKEIKLPHKLGSLELRKKPTRLAIVDGKLVTNMPIDWNATLKLWYEDKESYDNKVLIRIESEEIYKIYYNKHKADYTNKTFYEFNANREIKTALNRNIKAGLVDAFLFKKYD